MSHWPGLEMPPQPAGPALGREGNHRGPVREWPCRNCWTVCDSSSNTINGAGEPHLCFRKIMCLRCIYYARYLWDVHLARHSWTLCLGYETVVQCQQTVSPSKGSAGRDLVTSLKKLWMVLVRCLLL